MNTPILDIQGLTTRFMTRQGLVTAVEHVRLAIDSQETVCVVGESGSGKSVMALSVMGLLPRPHGKITEGVIDFQGRDLTRLSPREMKQIRGNRISMIFQEPMTSLNPVFTTGFQIAEVFRKHRGMTGKQAREEAIGMLGRVGIPEPRKRAGDYPHQLSGGMMQRVMIAMALSCRPALMIADEPTTALDVTIQAQILDLMLRLKTETGMAIWFITHDLGLVADIAQKVAVMYAGRIVEQAEVRELFGNPLHPYTIGLFNSLPRIGGKQGRLTPIQGSVPGLNQLPSGCAFRDRCASLASADCGSHPPALTEIRSGHWVACHLHKKSMD
jgi:oligopeptide/dipeptide ABC transporter ATP-binding protein